MIFVDTSVLLDVLSGDPKWSNWSAAALRQATATDEPAINGIIYAELSAGYPRMSEVDAAISTLGLSLVQVPKGACFLAGQAFRRHRSRGGERSGVLSDFFIGAHAAVEDAPVVTRDTKRIRGYFPTVKIISPEGSE